MTKVRRSSAGDTPIMMPDRRPQRQKQVRWGLILLGVLLLAVVAVAVYFYLSSAAGGAPAGMGGGGRRHK